MDLTFVPHSLRISFEPSEGSMMIDLSTIHGLETVQNLHDRRSSDCLLGLLDATMTPMGSRLLRSNILQPLLDQNVLQKRLDAVEELSTNENLFVSVKKTLCGFLDVDRALTDLIIMPGANKIQEWLRNSINYVLILKRFIADAKPISEALSTSQCTLLRQILEVCDCTALTQVEDVIDCWINEDTTFSRKPAELQAQRIFAVKSGKNGLLDVARQAFKETLEDVYELRENLSNRFSLDVSVEFDKRGRYLRFPAASIADCSLDMSVFVNVTKARKYIECQTMDLIKLNSRLAAAQVEVINMSMSSVQQLIEQARGYMAPLFRMSDSIALLDVLTSFASVGTQFGYVKPRLGNKLALKAARHPIRDKIGKTKFIPNDCHLDLDSRFQILTGCNMSGKSTYIRTIALLQIMAQVGCFVPAESATFTIRDQIFARVSTDDDVSANLSTFANEMREAAFILKNVTANSLAIIDELGRGTSTADGLAIATAIAEELLESRASVFFVTHFRRLAHHFAQRRGAVNLHFRVEVLRNPERMLMRYEIAPGPLELASYGIALAEAVGLPASMIESAKRASSMLREARAGACRTPAAAAAATAAMNIQERKRKLLFGLRDQLVAVAKAREGRVDDDDAADDDDDDNGTELRDWLRRLQDEFVVQMNRLCVEESETVRGERQEQGHGHGHGHGHGIGSWRCRGQSWSPRQHGRILSDGRTSSGPGDPSGLSAKGETLAGTRDTTSLDSALLPSESPTAYCSRRSRSRPSSITEHYHAVAESRRH